MRSWEALWRFWICLPLKYYKFQSITDEKVRESIVLFLYGRRLQTWYISCMPVVSFDERHGRAGKMRMCGFQIGKMRMLERIKIRILPTHANLTHTIVFLIVNGTLHQCSVACVIAACVRSNKRYSNRLAYWIFAYSRTCILYCKVRCVTASDWCQRYVPCRQPRPTSQKIWGGFLYRVYRSWEWLWIDSSGKNGN